MRFQAIDRNSWRVPLQGCHNGASVLFTIFERLQVYIGVPNQNEMGFAGLRPERRPNLKFEIRKREHWLSEPSRNRTDAGFMPAMGSPRRTREAAISRSGVLGEECRPHPSARAAPEHCWSAWSSPCAAPSAASRGTFPTTGEECVQRHSACADPTTAAGGTSATRGRNALECPLRRLAECDRLGRRATLTPRSPNLL